MSLTGDKIRQISIWNPAQPTKIDQITAYEIDENLEKLTILRAEGTSRNRTVKPRALRASWQATGKVSATGRFSFFQ